jgi:ATP-dependent RNA helicase DeaD
MARDLKARDDGDQLYAFLLKYFFTHHRMEKFLAAGGIPPVEQPRRESASERERGREERPRREGTREERPRRDRERRERKPRLDSGSPASSTADAPREAISSEPAPSPDGRQQLWVNLGATDQLDTAGVTSALVEIAGIAATDLGRVDVRATHTYVYVEPAIAEKLLAANGKDRQGKAVRVERPRKKR